MENTENIKEILRLSTAGSVDDGKSTLIGRLLYDSKSVFTDQLEAINISSKNKGFDYLDLSLLTDGLKSEREQGITIDVAYRYFETKKRKFIIADSPGHIEYTRNMVTGSSTSNLALILIDARNGILEQTFRHSFIASLLGIKHFVICINKMDLVNYDEIIFNKIVKEFKSFASKLNITDIRFIPISALDGDNVVIKSDNFPWYEGNTLFYELENVHIASDHNLIDCRFPVQNVIRPHRKGFEDFRGYSGLIEGGVFKTGDNVKILPSGFTSTIESIMIGEQYLNEAFPPMSVTMTLKDDLGISRGDMIVRPNNLPNITQEFDVLLTWMVKAPLIAGKKIIIKHTTRESLALVKEIYYELDINTLHRDIEVDQLKLNSIGKIKIQSASPIFADDYKINRKTGSLILIDSNTFETLGAGLISF